MPHLPLVHLGFLRNIWNIGAFLQKYFIAKINLYAVLMNFCILGKWSNPSIIGQCIPHTAYFIIDKINNTRAVLFGGLENDDTYSNNIYILEISVSTVVC